VRIETEEWKAKKQEEMNIASLNRFIASHKGPPKQAWSPICGPVKEK
jgi:hypothetical protein